VQSARVVTGLCPGLFRREHNKMMGYIQPDGLRMAVYNESSFSPDVFPMLTIRAATEADSALIRKLIWELADFEKAPDQVKTTAADIARDGFRVNPLFRALIAEWEGRPAGFALFFSYYSTWRGAGFHLEDLFVRPEFLGRGIGTSLLAHVACIAEKEKRVFIKWEVLNWNTPAI
jgi:GNAT superfamily N-acetyltransferase